MAARGAGPYNVAMNKEQETVQKLLDDVRARDLRMADLWFTELDGRPRRLSIPTRQLDAELFAAGIVLEGRNIGGAWEGLLLFKPDPVSARVDPVSTIPTISMICDVSGADSGEPSPAGSRHVLQRAEARLAASGAADSARIGVEPEFFLLSGGAPAPEEEVWEFLRSMAVALGDAGIDVDGFRTGPAPGQGRVQMRAAGPLAAADGVVFYKHVARILARRSGKEASFLPTPFPGAAGGMPMHVALLKDGRNVFHDESGWMFTSAECRGFAAGLLAHAPALAAFCAPSVNSYRRMCSAPDAPSNLILSRTDPKAACRIPARSRASASRRVKFRSLDSTCNPYLALAAVLAAGLDGLERGLEPPVEAPERRLPFCLEEALELLNGDRAFLLKGDVFTDLMIDSWIADRWRRQIEPSRAGPHPVELSLERE
jgi:glutamine synthetase